ncbi:beta-glucuronidase [Flavobacterium sp. MFBS3-15]|uniref:glycoside hydrolase family 2 protein n=1 Tax=Flavobacterium sp. MFBS3-15 TaxID=2989816 RepID=UPI002235E50C|nr:glycoside hydrolase family 2 TIM barrel-domain containing protein [Flavobacterium sp. MFBS3-15]MCW4468876.1 beta-glucuronidase [Flavobacterium sp. MFBS3-15]
MSSRLFTALFLLGFTTIFAQENLIVNAYNRTAQSLNGEWNYIVDPYENGYYNYRYEPFDQQEKPSKSAFFMNGKQADKTELLEYDFDKSPVMNIPGDWNTQDEKLFYYEGTVWFKKSFDYTGKAGNNRVFLYFGAVNYRADVYLNGKKLGTHIGGFTPFNYEVTGLVKAKDNFVVVKVDNKRCKECVPTLNTDWWNYGGITRDVQLVEVPQTFVREYELQLNHKNNRQISGFIKLDGNGTNKKVTVNIPELKINKEFTADANGLAPISIDVKKLRNWSPEDPYLYTISLSSGDDMINDKIGFRTIATKGHDILLNGKSIFLRGICIHEESVAGQNRAHSPEDARQLLTMAKELGCNYVRLAHYPHNEHMVRLADEMGLLVWEEIPVYWTIDWKNESTYKNAENQLTEMITRDRNRASVIIWSMANETPSTDARNAFLGRLAKQARTLDPTRLISAALEQSSPDGNPLVKTIDDPYADVVDVLSFNQYIGWYDGLPEKCSQVTWNITQDKPIIISEFGADAKSGYHADKLTRFSEEYQEYLYEETLKMLGKIKQLRGLSPWILKDFRSPRRQLPGLQDGWNRKGLYSETGKKKKGFYVLKRFYEEKLKQDK